MDGVMMIGKLLKVKQYNLEFGSRDRFVNVLGCFKYRPNGNVYIIYSDVDTKYNIIYYGSGHLKEDSVLCMPCRDKSEEEVIKEYIFKMIQKENMDNFEMFSLENVENIEIIASSKFEVKPEILTNLIDIIMPESVVEEVPKEEVKEVTNKEKKSSKSILMILLIVFVLLVCGCYFLVGSMSKDTTEKNIICIKSYQHNKLVAKVEETNKYNFNINDKLESINTTMIYQFDETNYQQFIMKGTYYKYMPSSDAEGSWDKDDAEYIFKVMTKIEVNTSYNKPTNYEEVLSYYKSEGYTCTEEIESK